MQLSDPNRIHLKIETVCFFDIEDDFNQLLTTVLKMRPD